MFEVQHYTICQGWINTWSIINDDDTQTPQQFATREEAQKELDAFFADIADEIASGEREEDQGYDEGDFRIEEVNHV